MQTHEWEALLDGTTPGPWEVETVPELRYSNGETWEELGHHVVYGENGPLFATGEQTWEDAEQYQDNEANIRLAAHAPAAVAEVVRLRRRLERMRANYELIATHADHPQALGVVHQINDDLARILEGEE